MLVEAFIAQLAVERFDEGILDRLAGCDEAQLHATLVRPAQHRLAGQLRAVVGRDPSRVGTGFGSGHVEGARDADRRQRRVGFDRRRTFGELVDDREDALHETVAQAGRGLHIADE